MFPHPEHLHPVVVHELLQATSISLPTWIIAMPSRPLPLVLPASGHQIGLIYALLSCHSFANEIRKAFISPRLRSLDFFFKFIFHWRIVEFTHFIEVQYTMLYYCCTAKWLSYTYIDIFFSIMVYHRISNIVPYAIQEDCHLSILYIPVCIC